jgi:hypothetical protein
VRGVCGEEVFGTDQLYAAIGTVVVTDAWLELDL